MHANSQKCKFKKITQNILTFNFLILYLKGHIGTGNNIISNTALHRLYIITLKYITQSLNLKDHTDSDTHNVSF